MADREVVLFLAIDEDHVKTVLDSAFSSLPDASLFVNGAHVSLYTPGRIVLGVHPRNVGSMGAVSRAMAFNRAADLLAYLKA